MLIITYRACDTNLDLHFSRFGGDNPYLKGTGSAFVNSTLPTLYSVYTASVEQIAPCTSFIGSNRAGHLVHYFPSRKCNTVGI